MKKMPVLFILLAVLAFAAANPPAAQAQQECRDAAGAVIPCPPTGGGDAGEDDSDSGDDGGAQPGGGNPNPPTVVTATPSPTPLPGPTNTPLPIIDRPTEDLTQITPVFEVTPTPTAKPVITSPKNNGTTEGKKDWEDVCTFDLCLGLIAICYWDGGSPEMFEDGSGNNGVRCTIPDEEEGAGASTPWGPIGIAILALILMALLLPAIQKLRNKPANPQKAKKIFIGGLSAKPKDPSSQTREHILLAKSGDKPQPKHKPFVITKELDKSIIGRDDIITREDKDKE